MSKLAAGLAALGFTLALAAPAFAHTALLGATPAPNSTISAPKSFKLTFSEKIVPAFSGIKVAMDDGMIIDIATKISSDGKIMTGTPKSSFMPGSYKLSWHAASGEDGHRTEGSYSFKVK